MSNGSRLIWRSAVTNMCDRNMTNLWLWNCFRNPWKLSRINTFYSTGKYSEFFKVWVNLFAMELARDYILLSQLRSSWRFPKFSEALRVYSNRNFYVRNHISQKAKGEISNWDTIANRKTAFQVQETFSVKQHPDCRHQWLEIQLL